MRKPLSVREGYREDDFDALHDGVPEWLEPALWEWFEAAIYAVAHHYREEALSVLRKIQNGLRRPSLNVDNTRRHGIEYGLRRHFREEPRDFLDVVEYLLPELKNASPFGFVDLETILEGGGSLWKVSQGGTSLIRRVPPETEAAAVRSMSPKDRASQHLRESWSDIFGRNPDPSDGYLQAVKAVEAIAQPVISPRDEKASLGKMIPAMRSKPSKWKVNLAHEDPEEQVRQVVGMMELLWKGHHDRHGKADPDAPFSASPEEAEAAVLLAVTLVDWFRTGVVTVRV